jgi:hypothetical protein
MRSSGVIIRLPLFYVHPAHLIASFWLFVVDLTYKFHVFFTMCIVSVAFLEQAENLCVHLERLLKFLFRYCPCIVNFIVALNKTVFLLMAISFVCWASVMYCGFLFSESPSLTRVHIVTWNWHRCITETVDFDFNDSGCNVDIYFLSCLLNRCVVCFCIR